MSEAIFPVFGPVLTFACVLPLTALLTKVLLVVIDATARQFGRPVPHELRYFLVVMASAAPLMWLVSASLHQSESGRSTSVCAVAHEVNDGFCPETLLFALSLLLWCGAFGLPRLLRARTAPESQRLKSSDAAFRRVVALLRSRSALTPLLGRCTVDDTLAVPIATLGMLRPRVVLRSGFVNQLDDEALLGALHHELVHLQGRDPLRYSIAWWALRVNPWGRWFLERELSLWLLERELHCDREAVLNGASGPAVAQAIVIAARPPGSQPMAALGIADAETLNLRVQVLLAYTECPPRRIRKQPALLATVLTMIALALLPHAGSTGALDALHLFAELSVMYLAG